MAGRKDSSLQVWLRDSLRNHCNGVTSLIIHDDVLYTGGRDASIRGWKVDLAAVSDISILQGHGDWVNDLAYDASHNIIFSASNDTTVRMWDASTCRELCSLRKHSDYVKTVSYASGPRVLVSAGIDSTIALWDVARPETDPSIFRGRTDSVYCSAVTAEASVLATGGADHHLRLWDWRSASKVATLRGHADAVRALAVSSDGTVALSGGSDRVLRVWDIGTRRCIRALRVCADSIWCIAASPDLSRVIVGGRDGRAVHVDVASGSWHVLFQEPAPLTRLALQGDNVWAATTDPAVHLWSATVSDGERLRSLSVSPVRAHSIPSSTSMRSVSALAAAQQPTHAAPLCTIAGAAPVDAAETLSDRVHILTHNTAGDLVLWNVLTGRVVQRYSGRHMSDVLQELQPMMNTPQWFTTRVNTGFLVLELRAGRVFGAETYAVDAGISAETDLQKVNLGERMIRSLFHYWAVGKRKLMEDAAEVKRTREEPSSTAEQPPSADDSPTAMQTETTSPPPPRADQASDSAPAAAKIAPVEPYPSDVPVVCVDASGAAVLWRTVGSLSGAESDSDLPLFVPEVVLHDNVPTPDPAKLQFLLLPALGSSLPEFPKTKQRLSAPRLLRIHRTAAYVAEKLGAAILRAVQAPQDATAPAAQPSPPSVSVTSNASTVPAASNSDTEEEAPLPEAEATALAKHLEILCGDTDRVLSGSLTLGAVKALIWRGSGEVVLRYRYKPEPGGAPDGKGEPMQE